ncbi:MAG: transketolase C-terminal domain-containing protein [Candidatus Woesearchaeota archaeon]
MKKLIFPINLKKYSKLKLDISKNKLSEIEKKKIIENIALVRDSIVFLTAYSGSKGLSGHTGGAYDIAPEAVIIDCLIRNKKNKIYPVMFDEAGHRVAIQYLFAAINNQISLNNLFYYRDYNKGLYGHPERNEKEGIFFSSGRLGHLWSYVNGLCQANPNLHFVLFGSDGSQQEGNDAEAARYAVANNLNITLLIDDNDVTISGYPSKYMKGYNLKNTLEGHGLLTYTINPEDVDELYRNIRNSILDNKPSALLNKRKMAIGIDGLEGSPKGHEVISVDSAVKYLSIKGYSKAIKLLKNSKQSIENYSYKGSSFERFSNRDEFGKTINEIIKKNKVKPNNLLVIDNDLEGSTGLKHIHDKNPDFFQMAGIMERNNFSVAAGFGSSPDKQAIYSTFSAFTEMIISEITMARLNHSNVIAHFSHAGVDEIADNTCHFGINNFFVDNGIIEKDITKLYYPADVNQLKAIINTIFNKKGLRFIFTTRSKTPKILKDNNNEFFSGNYKFVDGKDELIVKGEIGYIVSYGEMLYRCLDAVIRLREYGINIGLINKPTLNIMDKTILDKLLKLKFILVVESQNKNTGLGIRYGTWLLENGFKGNYSHLGTTKLGKGGLWQQIYNQSLDSKSIVKKVKKMISLKK